MFHQGEFEKLPSTLVELSSLHNIDCFIVSHTCTSTFHGEISVSTNDSLSVYPLNYGEDV